MKDKTAAIVLLVVASFVLMFVTMVLFVIATYTGNAEPWYSSAFGSMTMLGSVACAFNAGQRNARP